MKKINKKILFIEDEKYQRDLYYKIFTEAGYKFKAINDPKNALKIIQREKPDLVLLDLVFSINGQLIMNKSREKGFNFLKRLKQNIKTKNIPIIMVSNLSAKGKHKAKALKLGADEFLNKAKILPHELIKIVEQILEKEKTTSAR
ncbi:hypothetical protein CL633_02620 [bacterium]|nr:hypothetical protein [bacterium]|tara:strand:- start:202 stop:636 length:435 start_codon:yes stop_codon:yes gene_type:complete